MSDNSEVSFSLAIGCTVIATGQALDSDFHSSAVLNICDSLTTCIFTHGVTSGYDPEAQTFERTIIVQGLTDNPTALLSTAIEYARVEMQQNAVGWFTANPDDSYVPTTYEWTAQ